MPKISRRLPTFYPKAARRGPRRDAAPPAGRIRVATGLYGYSPYDATRSKRPPTPVEEVQAYRNASYVCASIRAEGVAGQPVRLYATTDRRLGQKAPRCPTRPLAKYQVKNFAGNPALSKRLAGVDSVEEVTSHPILDLLEWVNPFLSKSQLFELTQLYLDINGRWYWYKVGPDDGPPTEVWPLPSWMVYNVPDYSGTEVIDKYIFTGGGGTVELEKSKVLYGRELSLFDPYTQGWGPLRANYELSQIYDKNQDYRDSVLSNRGRPDAMLVPNEEGGEMTVDPAAIERITSEYEQSYGLGRAGRLWVPPGGMKLQPVSWSPMDMGELALSKSALHDIARGFKVPIALVDGEAATRASMDASLLQFARFCVKPACRKLEEYLNSNFVNLWDDRLFLAFDDPVPADKVLERETNIAYVKEGIWSRNEVRADTGRDPADGGDEPMVPSGLVPLSKVSAAADAAMRPDPAPGAGQPGDPEEGADDEPFGEGDDAESDGESKAWEGDDRRPFTLTAESLAAESLALTRSLRPS